eukprot:TRINITY_DN36387_c0_g1_i1.p1 TRINITY_DN36387_c0_g1~~TRINITY_DN36387_c0_g1_i1.p1  ORF type:complete len:400 (+),score=78.11 TRINITY_DN36387_c0_g1_i1:72-1202(+)
MALRPPSVRPPAGPAPAAGLGPPPPIEPQPQPQGDGLDASLGVARIMWLVGGIFGLHHWYLQRYRHMLVYMATLGLFGVGWIRDGWRLRHYVALANGAPLPDGALSSWFGTLLIAYDASYVSLFSWAVVFTPADRWSDAWLKGPWLWACKCLALLGAAQLLCIAPEGLSLGALAERRASLAVFLSLYAAAEFHLLPGGALDEKHLSALREAVFFTIPLWLRTAQPLRTPRRDSALRRALILLTAVAVPCGLVCTFSVPVGTGQQRRHLSLFELAHYFSHCPRLGEAYQFEGRAALRRFGELTELCHSRIVAGQVFGIPPDADWATVKEAYRRSSRRCHPDLVGGGPEKRQEWLRVNHAYQTFYEWHGSRGERSDVL